MDLFCSICGTKLSAEDKTCPTCGQANPYHADNIKAIAEEYVSNQQNENKAVNKFYSIQITLGFVFLVIGLILSVVGLESNIFIALDGFGCAVCAGICVVFSIIGKTKNEPASKLTTYTLIASAFFAISTLFYFII